MKTPHLLLGGTLLAVLVSALIGACGGTTAPSSCSGSNCVGTGGATVTGTGTIAGSQVTIPAGALATATTITLQAGTAVSQSGLQTAGPAVTAGPAGTTFAIPVSVTVPVTVPAGNSINNVVVLKQDPSGTTTLVPTSVNAAAGTVTVQVSSFSTFEAAVNSFTGTWNIAFTPTSETGDCANGGGEPLNQPLTIGAATVSSSGSVTLTQPRSVAVGTMNLSTGAWSIPTFSAGSGCGTADPTSTGTASGTCTSSTACSGTITITSSPGPGTTIGTSTWSRP
jgi:hypothetical protein